jgi:hypothetical protein
MNSLAQIINYDPIVIEMALGDAGKSLYNFIKIADLENEEIYEYIDEEICDKILQIIRLVDYGYKNNLDKSIISLSKFYKKIISNDFCSLEKKVRFIKNLETREEYRREKKSYQISLITFYKKCHILWHNLPDNFDCYERYSTKNNSEELRIKSNRFAELNCDFIKDCIDEHIKDIEFNYSKIIFGFNKISIRNASVILSKFHGYKLKKHDRYHLIKNEDEVYSPKIYPLHYFDKTEKISRLIEDLESDSIFDHYMILMPSYREKDKITSFEEESELIKNKSITPILLGDRDGESYFISYWN